MTDARDGDRDVHTCPSCGDPMFADEEWRIRNNLAIGLSASEGEYVHARCKNGE